MGNFLSGPLDNYKEHRGANNRNLIVSNEAVSQTVKKPFLQLTHPAPISIYNAMGCRGARISPLFVIKVIVFCELKQKAHWNKGLEQTHIVGGVYII